MAKVSAMRRGVPMFRQGYRFKNMHTYSVAFTQRELKCTSVHVYCYIKQKNKILPRSYLQPPGPPMFPNACCRSGTRSKSWITNYGPLRWLSHKGVIKPHHKPIIIWEGSRVSSVTFNLDNHPSKEKGQHTSWRLYSILAPRWWNEISSGWFQKSRLKFNMCVN